MGGRQKTTLFIVKESVTQSSVSKPSEQQKKKAKKSS